MSVNASPEHPSSDSVKPDSTPPNGPSLDSAQLLFRAVVQLPFSERSRVLNAACYDQPRLRNAVEKLLDGREPPVNQPEPRPTQAYPPAPPSSAGIGFESGSTVGRYKLLDKLGEGGFGTVFLAQQVEPVRRRVALKIIKLGMDTRQVIARFEAERQALAMMDHPHIARVLDAGATDSGRPYFVMELVRGEPITEFCDRQRFSVRQRLELFQQICLAVQHAHQKGIIHRDIKPGNVLVTRTDGLPHVKVIDFGIAKATNSELTEKTLFTEFQQWMGTPVYMSPEQIERAGLDIDTRTDIYSMGVLLYELLSGSPPFDPQRVKSASWSELQRMICDEEPPTMSARISSPISMGNSIAKQRSAEVLRLRFLLRGDLDWIVMKAIDKSRSRRYGGASEMNEDIGRYLRDEPVSATPPTPVYRLQKLLRRHRVAFAIGATLFMGLSIALLVSSSFTVWALSERERAQQAVAQARDQARRAERFSTLAGNPFLAAEDVAKANANWGSEIRTLGDSLPEESPKRIRKECQYATWLVSQAILNKRPDLLRQSVVDLAQLHERAKRVLGTNDSHFLSLANARAQAAILLEKQSPEEIGRLLEDVVTSYRQTRGSQDTGYTDLLMERALSTMLTGAGSGGPTVEALSVVVDTFAKTGIAREKKAILQEQLQALIEKAGSWAQVQPPWTKRLSKWKSEKGPRQTLSQPKPPSQLPPQRPQTTAIPTDDPESP